MQENSETPTLTCKPCSRRYLVSSRQGPSEAFCADPQFVLCQAPDDSCFFSDEALSIGNPGHIDVESSDGTHRIVSGGSSAHESIILRTRSSRNSFTGSADDDAPADVTTVEGLDEALRGRYLVKATSTCIRAGLAEPAPPLPETRAGDGHSPDTAHADEVLDYLRSFTVNEDEESPFLPFLHSPSKPLPVDAIRALILRAQQLFAEEPRVLAVPEDVRVFSDIHGNFKDLLIWQRLFWPDGAALLQGSVLWLGDYVDRGLNSVEVLLYMLAQKVFVTLASLLIFPFIYICLCCSFVLPHHQHPSSLIHSQVKNPSKWLMLRGNHEARLMNGWVDHYGAGSFQNLCLKAETDAGLLPKELWLQFNTVFDYLPIAAVRLTCHNTIDNSLCLSLITLPLSQAIQGSIFAVHGGLPRRSTWDHQPPTGAPQTPCSLDHAFSELCVAEAEAPAGDITPPARPPIELLLETLPRPWNGENPHNASNMVCTAG